MSSNACPNCEYKHGNAGKPVSKGSTIECLVCGTTWKEFSGSGTPLLEKPEKSTTIAHLRKLARAGNTAEEYDLSFEQTSSTPVSTGSTFSTLLPQAVLFVAILLAGIGTTIWFLEQLAPSAAKPSNRVEVSDIKLKEKIGRDGRKIITVQGKIDNHTERTKAIPRVAIILRRKDGGEIVRWRYNPANLVLQPGKNTRFASSIQYDTPVVAYAEAIIE